MSRVAATARLSPCALYRYELTRAWDDGVLFASRGELVVVMLNPSTADAERDDPTIRRVVGFAKRDGFSSLRVLNLFALRSTNPNALVHEAAVGPDNDQALRDALAAAVARDVPVLAAWGASPWTVARVPHVLALVPGVTWVCLGRTKDGAPRHPLYVAGDQPLVPFDSEAAR
jgi:hypothetical protein